MGTMPPAKRPAKTAADRLRSVFKTTTPVRQQPVSRQEQFLRTWTAPTTAHVKDVEHVPGAVLSAAEASCNWNALEGIKSQTRNFSNRQQGLELVLRDHVQVVLWQINSLKSGEYILVAMAWLTNHLILDALSQAARTRGVFVQIILQKERWLDSREALSQKYTALGHNKYVRGAAPFTQPNSVVTEDRSGRGVITVDAVRTFGDGNDNETRPLSHHKMCIIGKVVHSLNGTTAHVAKRVIVGSFNWTQRSPRSLESFIIVHSEGAAQCAQQHFSAMLCDSDPLHFKTLCKASSGSFSPRSASRPKTTPSRS